MSQDFRRDVWKSTSQTLKSSFDFTSEIVTVSLSSSGVDSLLPKPFPDSVLAEETEACVFFLFFVFFRTVHTCNNTRDFQKKGWKPQSKGFPSEHLIVSHLDKMHDASDTIKTTNMVLALKRSGV